MSFLLTLLLLFLLSALLSPLLRVVAAVVRALRQAGRPPQGADAGSCGGEGGAAGGYTWPFGRSRRHGPRRKVFAPDEGEYVRFEEVEVDLGEEQERRRRFATADFRVEDQVSDAEWTDLRQPRDR